jgi:hypothetical protein
LNENFNALDDDLVEHRAARDPDPNQETPADGAKFLRTDTGEIWIANGTEWGTVEWNLGNIGTGGTGDVDWQDDGTTVTTAAVANLRDNLSVSEGGSGEAIIDAASGGTGTSTDGIASETDHVGPFRQGGDHSTAGSGTMFWAQSGLSINSAVIHTNLTNVSTTDFPVTLAHYESGAIDPTEVGSTTVTVSGGPERIDLSALPDIPSDGEYVLARDQSSNGETVPAWRITESNWGTAAYDEHTYDRIDFRKGTNIRESGDFGSEGYYYYFFDISIGDAYDQVTSPWSHDVDQIFMRPTAPEEEYDNVSPRSLWFDTS